MRFIDFEKEKCDNCYKCLRVCPTKAISFYKNDRKIIDDKCIKCGLCQASCPQEALKISSQLEDVKAMMRNNEKLAVSLAPSFVGAFGLREPEKMVGALKSVGFSIVEETAFGAEIIASYYDEAIESGEYKNIITSCCPSANYLIEQHYPSLINSIMPVVSPMIAHGRSIKERYGTETKVVFIGPCLAKMAEAEEMQGAIDAVLTFEELDSLMRNTNKNIEDYDKVPFDVPSSLRGRAFPLGGSLKNKVNKRREDDRYRFIHVDGIEPCKEILTDLSKGNIENCCVEINICEGSCINGPDMPKNHLGRFERENYLSEYAKNKLVHGEGDINESEINEALTEAFSITRSFSNKQKVRPEPGNKIIRETMKKMGKYTKDDELNCGACGYKTCYDKAKAVYYRHSDVHTCLPYLREKAESMQNVMIENSPNAVILIDKDLMIIEVNPSFMNMLNKDGLPVIDMPIALFVPSKAFEDSLSNKSSMYNKKIYIEESDSYFLSNIIYLDEGEMIVAFMTDISEDELRRQEFNRVKEETLLKTQEVIDKQMRVAQEIASLLGETTAETKMSLRSLNELVLSDQRGILR